jgi:hypothetical protein
LVPRSVLRASASRDEISIVDATGFAMQLDIWLIHLREFGNLKRAIETLAAMVADGFARYDVAGIALAKIHSASSTSSSLGKSAAMRSRTCSTSTRSSTRKKNGAASKRLAPSWSPA